MLGIDVAKSKKGLEEVRNRKELIEFFKEYAKNGDIVVDPSTTAWCAVFVNACERAVGNAGNGRQNARSFLSYGTKVSLKDAKRGDIVVFARGGSSWMGHVTYLESIDGDTLICLGGNQGDSVKYSYYDTDRLLGIRRP